ELREKSRPLWPAVWSRSTVLTSSYGHGVAITPLHLASAYAALVNGGVWRPATLMKVEAGKAPQGRRVFTEETSHRMRQMLRLVVLHGSGKKGEAIGYRVGGKTGTANKPVAGGYSNTRVVTSFAGVFPMDDPRYVIVVMLDEPKGIAETHGFRTAGWNVAPVVSKTVSRIAPMLGVTPDKQREPDLGEVLPFIQQKAN
nr:penicillin-binding protein 2 [Sphingomonas sp.]